MCTTKTQKEKEIPVGFREDVEVYEYWNQRYQPLDYAVLLAIYDRYRVEEKLTVQVSFYLTESMRRIIGINV